MPNSDIPCTYRTLAETGQAEFKDKGSRFIAFAYPVRTAAEVKSHVDALRQEHHKARHWCYAYRLGTDGLQFRANDDGEPSSTAGKPILGQINSNNLTDILIIVVRYFGGIELGTSGLIVAYRTAAAEAIAAARIEERTVDETITITFEYPHLNSVMRIVKEDKPDVLAQSFELTCEMTLRIRQSRMDALKSRLLKVDSLRIV